MNTAEARAAKHGYRPEMIVLVACICAFEVFVEEVLLPWLSFSDYNGEG